jgi:hypothetical protein
MEFCDRESPAIEELEEEFNLRRFGDIDHACSSLSFNLSVFLATRAEARSGVDMLDTASKRPIAF